MCQLSPGDGITTKRGKVHEVHGVRAIPEEANAGTGGTSPSSRISRTVSSGESRRTLNRRPVGRGGAYRVKERAGSKDRPSHAGTAGGL